MNTEVSTDSAALAHPDRIKRARELPALRFDIDEAKQILRMSRAQLYTRIAEGAIAIQKDGARTYISLQELERYVEACEHRSQSVGKPLASVFVISIEIHWVSLSSLWPSWEFQRKA